MARRPEQRHARLVAAIFATAQPGRAALVVLTGAAPQPAPARHLRCCRQCALPRLECAYRRPHSQPHQLSLPGTGQGLGGSVSRDLCADLLEATRRTLIPWRHRWEVTMARRRIGQEDLIALPEP